jgi:hypothetical protein
MSAPTLAEFFAAQARFFSRATVDIDGATDALLTDLPGWSSPRGRLQLYARFARHHVRNVLGKLYPACRAALPASTWDALTQLHDARRPARTWELNASGAGLPELIDELLASPREEVGRLPAWLPALARLEWATFEVYRHDVLVPLTSPRLAANPTLVALENLWALAAYVNAPEPRPEPREETEVALLWRHPRTALAHVRPASPRALLALKVALEGLEPAAVAREAGLPADQVEAAVREQVAHGVLIGP